MASSTRNLSSLEGNERPSGKGKTIGIVVSEWNSEITNSLLKGALKTLKENKVSNNNIIIDYVPGSFELTLGAQRLCENKKIDAVICIGCVIQGDTPHFDFICDAVANGIMNLNIKYNKPVIFGVLTTNHKQQALERAGGGYGNKGIEAAISVLKMLR